MNPKSTPAQRRFACASELRRSPTYPQDDDDQPLEGAALVNFITEQFDADSRPEAEEHSPVTCWLLMLVLEPHHTYGPVECPTEAEVQKAIRAFAAKLRVPRPQWRIFGRCIWLSEVENKRSALWLLLRLEGNTKLAGAKLLKSLQHLNEGG